jgi:hypothetical protein
MESVVCGCDRAVPRYSSAYLAKSACPPHSCPRSVLHILGTAFCSLGVFGLEITPQFFLTFAPLSEGFKDWEASIFILQALLLTTYTLLSSALSKYVSGPTEEDFKKSENQITSERIDTAVRKAFLDVDHGAVDQARDMIVSSPSKALNLVQLPVAISGCTGMLAIYDESTRILKVALHITLLVGCNG